LLYTETAIIPIMCGELETAVRLAQYCQDRGIFVQAIIAPVVPEGQARLRSTVCATHTLADLDYCAETLIAGAKEIGGIL
jgi:7-keto-8-aminopelargonate synthetase-like enzyme